MPHFFILVSTQSANITRRVVGVIGLKVVEHEIIINLLLATLDFLNKVLRTPLGVFALVFNVALSLSLI